VVTYLYGLLLARNSPRLTLPIRGIGGSPIRVLRCGVLEGVVATMDAAPEPRLDAVREHDAALQSAVEAGVTVVAARFGQTFPDDAACCMHVAERSEGLTRLLEENDGCVEMRLLTLARDRDVPPAPAPGDPQHPGRAYLEQLRAAHERVSRLSVREALGDVVRAEVVEELPKSGIAISHLIRASDQRKYRDAVARVPSVARARIVGPLALYAFVSQ
jgi:hypothetical protein